MKIIEKNIALVPPNWLKTYKSIYLDIETTGLSADKNIIYSIGCAYFSENTLFFKQWFCEEFQDEVLILKDFSNFIKAFDTIICFNGTTFDIPFINKRCVKNTLSEALIDYKIIDLYKIISSKRKYINLPNFKQKTIEQAFNIHRDDEFNGRELITMYNAFVQMNSLKTDSAIESSKELFEVIFAHNYEDVINMVYISSILDIKELIQTNEFTYYIDTNENILIIHLNADFIKEYYSVYKNYFSILKMPFYIENNTIILILKLFQGELKFFLPNYKDYFYLPYEDTCIHKSVGAYVDKDYRKKATKETCYIKKNSSFIELDINYFSENQMVFKHNLNDDMGYLELENISSDTTLLPSIINYFTEKYL